MEIGLTEVLEKVKSCCREKSDIDKPRFFRANIRLRKGCRLRTAIHLHITRKTNAEYGQLQTFHNISRNLVHKN